MDKLVWKIVLDLVLLVCLASPLLFFFLRRPEPGGFFEDDRTLRLPYIPQTVAEAVQAPVGFALVIVTVLIVEYVREKKSVDVSNRFLCGLRMPGWVWESYVINGVFIFGAVMQQVTSEMVKRITGILRPHFFDVCRPIYNASDPANAYGYIQVYTCEDPDDPRVKELAGSFPSGHASFGMYVAVFFIIYLQLKCKWRSSKLLRHVFQFLAFLGALYAGYSRIIENFHHRDDVTVGFFNGALFSILVVKYVLKPEKHRQGMWQTTSPQNNLPRPATTL